MKKNYFYALCLVVAVSSKLCAAEGLVEHYERLKIVYKTRIDQLRAIEGTEDCVTFVAKELRAAEEKSRLYSLNLDRVAGVFEMLLTPRFRPPHQYYGQYHHQVWEQNALVHFLGGLQRGTELSLSFSDHPHLQEQIRPALIEVTAELAQILSTSAMESGDLSLTFNAFTLNNLCRIGNTARLFAKEADEELKVKSLLLRKVILEPGEPSAETKKLAKDVAGANLEKRLLSRVVEGFEAIEKALKAAGRMS